MVDGYYRTESANNIVHIGDPIYSAALYTLALLGILGVHEMGHLVASRIHKVKTSCRILFLDCPYTVCPPLVRLSALAAVHQIA